MDLKLSIDGAGFRRAVDGFGQLEPRLRKNVVAAANREAMRYYLARAKAAAPVRVPKTPGAQFVRHKFKSGGYGPARAPGFLQREFKVRARRTGRKANKVSHILHKNRARHLQFVVQGLGGRGHGSTPNPFLGRVFQSGQREVVNRWAVQFVKGYRREVKKLHG